MQKTTPYCSLADSKDSGQNQDYSSGVLDEDECAIVPKDFEEDHSPSERFSGEFSPFFLESYPDHCPDAFAQEMFNFFNFHCHRYRRCFDTPEASPRNEEVLSAIKNRGHAGCCTFKRETSKYILHPLAPWMFEPRYLGRRHYYTSDRRSALLYLDIDRHHEYQTEADVAAARSVIEQACTDSFGVSPLFLSSERGSNGYLKVDLGGDAHPQRANDIFDDLQAAIRLLFAKHGVLTDFEIKGTIAWLDDEGHLHGARYGKLPVSSSEWSYAWHLSLVKAKQVTLTDLERFSAEARAQVTEEDVERHEEKKHQAIVLHYLPLENKEQRSKLIVALDSGWEDQCLLHRGQTWVPKRLVPQILKDKLWRNIEKETYERDNVEVSCPVQCAGRTVRPGPSEQDRGSDRTAAAGAENLQSTGRTSRLPNVYVADLVNEPDSFVRQKEALRRLARAMRRVPTLAEALEFIKVNGLYSGAWHNPNRKTRVRGILKYIARTFDSRKCSQPRPGHCMCCSLRSPHKGQAAPTPSETRSWGHGASVNVGKFDGWAKKAFPNGFTGGKRKVVDEDGEVFEIDQNIKIGPAFLAMYMSLVEFALLIDKNEDGSLPHERAKELWTSLYDNGRVSVKFDDRKWAICREETVKYGIVVITDRDYGPDKAMRWAVGVYFPTLGLWKAKKQSSVLEPGELKADKRRELHNSLLRKQSFSCAGVERFPHPRPPPILDTD